MLTFTISIALFIVNVLVYADVSEFCGEVTLLGWQGGIKYFANNKNTSKSCKWIVSPTNNSIITIRILKFEFSDSSTCVLVKNSTEIELEVCGNDINKPTLLSSRTRVSIILNYINFVFFRLEYSVRPNTECGSYDFQCSDQSSCYNSEDICISFVCKDRSDATGCGKCNSSSTLCGNYTTDDCFDPYTQRCDGSLDCPKGDDEFYCAKSSPDVTSVFFMIMFVVCTICCTLAVGFLFRWFYRRRESQNPIDFPREFCENNSEPSNSDLFESDFTSGGTIYEHYVSVMRHKERSAGSFLSNEEVITFPFENLDEENELVVLASLSVPAEMCIGLELPESSKETINTLQSVNVVQEMPSTSGNHLKNFKSLPRRRSKSKKIVKYDRPKTLMVLENENVRFSKSDTSDQSRLKYDEHLSRICKSAEEFHKTNQDTTFKKTDDIV